MTTTLQDWMREKVDTRTKLVANLKKGYDRLKPLIEDEGKRACLYENSTIELIDYVTWKKSHRGLLQWQKELGFVDSIQFGPKELVGPLIHTRQGYVDVKRTIGTFYPAGSEDFSDFIETADDLMQELRDCSQILQAIRERKNLSEEDVEILLEADQIIKLLDESQGCLDELLKKISPPKPGQTASIEFTQRLLCFNKDCVVREGDIEGATIHAQGIQGTAMLWIRDGSRNIKKLLPNRQGQVSISFADYFVGQRTRYVFELRWGSEQEHYIPLGIMSIAVTTPIVWISEENNQDLATLTTQQGIALIDPNQMKDKAQIYVRCGTKGQDNQYRLDDQHAPIYHNNNKDTYVIGSAQFAFLAAAEEVELECTYRAESRISLKKVKITSNSVVVIDCKELDRVATPLQISCTSAKGSWMFALEKYVIDNYQEYHKHMPPGEQNTDKSCLTWYQQRIGRVTRGTSAIAAREIDQAMINRLGLIPIEQSQTEHVSSYVVPSQGAGAHLEEGTLLVGRDRREIILFWNYTFIPQTAQITLSCNERQETFSIKVGWFITHSQCVIDLDQAKQLLGIEGDGEMSITMTAQSEDLQEQITLPVVIGSYRRKQDLDKDWFVVEHISAEQRDEWLASDDNTPFPTEQDLPSYVRGEHRITNDKVVLPKEEFVSLLWDWRDRTPRSFSAVLFFNEEEMEESEQYVDREDLVNPLIVKLRVARLRELMVEQQMSSVKIDFLIGRRKSSLTLTKLEPPDDPTMIITDKSNELFTAEHPLLINNRASVIQLHIQVENATPDAIRYLMDDAETPSGDVHSALQEGVFEINGLALLEQTNYGKSKTIKTGTITIAAYQEQNRLCHLTIPYQVWDEEDVGLSDLTERVKSRYEAVGIEDVPGHEHLSDEIKALLRGLFK